jgi:O-acetyl-ADP-ribose deacetylase (regulator of RNase III)
MIMAEPHDSAKTEFVFNRTTVKIIEGSILAPGFQVDVLVSSDDNHLTMGSGISRALSAKAGPQYVYDAQVQCPVPAGTVVCTQPYGLAETQASPKLVFHGTVIDYDTDCRTEEIVYQTTLNCLEKIEQINQQAQSQPEQSRLQSILFPAFATGAGGLTFKACAREMCGAIKHHLAQERRLKLIYLILRPAEDEEQTERNRSFIDAANLVLDVPFDPTLDTTQGRDFFRREQEIQVLEAIINREPGSRRHAMIVGGPRSGKSALINQLIERIRTRPAPATPQRVVRVTFGRVHPSTPSSFIYRKLVLALSESEADQDVRNALRTAYTNTEMESAQFVDLLNERADHYGHVTFLVDGLEKLLQMVDDDFWDGLDELGRRVQLILAAPAGQQTEELRARLNKSLPGELEEVPLLCPTEADCAAWIKELFERYLGREPQQKEYLFFKHHAGRHPYLISLVGYASIVMLKRGRPLKHAEQMFDRPRRIFFDSMLKDRLLQKEEKSILESLAIAIDLEEKRRALIQDVEQKNRNAEERLEELLNQKNPRMGLDKGLLSRLAERGYLVEADEPSTVQFMAESFEAWVRQYFGIGDRSDNQPKDVVIGLLNPEPDQLSTLFGRRGARLVSAQKRLPQDIRERFLEDFRSKISSSLKHNSPFEKLDRVANFILTYFATDEIKAYLHNPPEGATILLTVDDALKDIPWELMIEFAYPGSEAPFKVGRSIVSSQHPHNIRPPVRGEAAIRALLIGDPTGDLADARDEIRDLYDKLRVHPLFEVDEADLWIGPDQCTSLALLDALSSGRYGLIHYSGHSKFDGHQSAWQLKDGRITTDLLTNALQNAPPVLVFSASCESAVSGAYQPARYENQTFDLPSAFLQAGVEAYIGTLWSVDAQASRYFVEAFYDAFLDDQKVKSLGECLWYAKRAISREQDRLAFILYGDPNAQPDELYPVLAPKPAANS